MQTHRLHSIAPLRCVACTTYRRGYSKPHRTKSCGMGQLHKRTGMLECLNVKSVGFAETLAILEAFAKAFAILLAPAFIFAFALIFSKSLILAFTCILAFASIFAEVFASLLAKTILAETFTV